jgi:hypothetical protein
VVGVVGEVGVERREWGRGGGRDPYEDEDEDDWGGKRMHRFFRITHTQATATAGTPFSSRRIITTMRRETHRQKSLSRLDGGVRRGAGDTGVTGVDTTFPYATETKDAALTTMLEMLSPPRRPVLPFPAVLLRSTTLAMKVSSSFPEETLCR